MPLVAAPIVRRAVDLRRRSRFRPNQSGRHEKTRWGEEHQQNGVYEGTGKAWGHFASDSRSMACHDAVKADHGESEADRQRIEA